MFFAAAHTAAQPFNADFYATERRGAWLGDHLTAITLIASLIDQAERLLPELVASALLNGHTWHEIAAALATSPEQAQLRYGPPVPDRRHQMAIRPLARNAAAPQRQVPAFLDRCHIAADEAAGPDGAPAAKRGRTTWRCGKRRPQSATRKAAGNRAKPACQSTARLRQTAHETRDAAGLTNIGASFGG